MNPANSEEFTIGYYLGKEIGDYNLDLGIRLDQIDRSGSVTDEDHGDVDLSLIHISEPTRPY